MRWRLLPTSEGDARWNMALDEAVSEAVSDGVSPPSLRLYRWRPSAVSIGYFQSLEREVDVEACRRDGVDFVRRRTGGGAVYHDSEGEVTYSVAAPLDVYPEDLTESYRAICGRVVDALARLGIDAEFTPINDVVVDGRKISGNAQTRRMDVLLQHGTVLHDVDPERMFTYLMPDVDKVSDKHVSDVRERVTSVSREADVGVDDTARALREAFTEGRDWFEGEPSEREVRRAEELSEERYGSREWNEMK
ncbi:MAG: biotin/lipoate A/B protein ligase family protein [Halobacteriales archaeon]